jgi:hypothetical protein
MSSTFRTARIFALATILLLSHAVPVSVRALNHFSAALIPETSDIRAAHADVATGRLDLLFSTPAVIETSRLSGTRVRFSSEANSRYVYAVFVPERGGTFSVATAGTYVLRRSRRDGSIDQLKVFLRDHPGFFVRIRPTGAAQSEMSVVLGGTEIHTNLPVASSVAEILASPLSHLFGLTDSRVRWNLFYPDVSATEHRITESVAERARATLHLLPDAEDGAMDQNGNLVRIESLVLQEDQPGFNCSGFAKWVVDGLYKARYDAYLPIDQLKTKHLEHRGTSQSRRYEAERDPYFGLDWTRNLATFVREAPGSTFQPHPESADVRSVAFARYTEDVGYEVAQLPMIMFLLASTEPGHLYLASISRDHGSNPILHQHVHVAVLFPYFEESGRFQVAVFERNVETSLASLDQRYTADSVHLVRVELSEAYAPPVIHN